MINTDPYAQIWWGQESQGTYLQPSWPRLCPTDGDNVLFNDIYCSQNHCINACGKKMPDSIKTLLTYFPWREVNYKEFCNEKGELKQEKTDMSITHEINNYVYILLQLSAKTQEPEVLNVYASRDSANKARERHNIKLKTRKFKQPYLAVLKKRIKGDCLLLKGRQERVGSKND